MTFFAKQPVYYYNKSRPVQKGLYLPVLLQYATQAYRDIRLPTFRSGVYHLAQTSAALIQLDTWKIVFGSVTPVWDYRIFSLKFLIINVLPDRYRSRAIELSEYRFITSSSQRNYLQIAFSWHLRYCVQEFYMNISKGDTFSSKTDRRMKLFGLIYEEILKNVKNGYQYAECERNGNAVTYGVENIDT